MTQTQPVIDYQVAMSAPTSHLFEVTLSIKNWQKTTLDLKFPVWTPGSYLVREYSKHLQNFQANTEAKESLPHTRISKNHWQVQTKEQSRIIISYKIYANELSVRTNHLDATHGYFNGAALFFFIPSLEKESISLEIIPPCSDWKVSTTLDKIAGKENTFIAKDFDNLVDSPVEIGTQSIDNFTVLELPHQLVVWGKGNLEPKKVIEDITKIVKTEAKIFGGLPYKQYLFLLHLSSNSYGGLEHKEGCSLLYARFGFGNRERYHNFIQLVAHEFFHLWNVKRIRPKELEDFDYEKENYTNSLWFSEGATSYYDILIPHWAGLYSPKVVLEKLSKDVTRFLNTPGRKVQSVAESSFDAWIKLYRRDSNSDNSQISYYLKGEIVSWCLDLLIRNHHQNRKSLNDVMRQLWQKFGQAEIGFTEKDLQASIEAVAEKDLSDFFTRYIYGVEEIPLNEYLEPFGLLVKPTSPEALPYLGLRVQSEGGKEIIKYVEIGSPAQLAGIDPEDELLAINRLRVTAEQLTERIKDYQVNDIIEISVFHQDELRNLHIQLGQPQANRYEVVQIQSPSDHQKQNFLGWIGLGNKQNI